MTFHILKSFQVEVPSYQDATFKARAEQPLRFMSAAPQPACRRAREENPAANSSQQLKLHAMVRDTTSATHGV
jgi:hypothetical protein